MHKVFQLTGEGAGKFAAPAAAVAPQEFGSGTDVLQIFASLLLVLATIVLVGWLARRLKTLPTRSAGALRTVDEVVLGAKERAVLVEVDGARLLLGVGDGRVVFLWRSDLPAAANPNATALATTPPPVRFIDLLRGMRR